MLTKMEEPESRSHCCSRTCNPLESVMGPISFCECSVHGVTAMDARSCMPSPTHPDVSCLSLYPGIQRNEPPRPTLRLPVIRRQYPDAAKARIEEKGIPLPNYGPTTAALLAYAESHWLPPTVNWDYVLTLFRAAYSPYFLRLPQIEMRVNVKYAIPGEVKPVMYSSEHEALVFAVDREDNGDAKPREAERHSDEEEDGSAEVFYLNCRTFELYAFDPEHAPNVPPPETIHELLILIGTAPPPAPSTILGQDTFPVHERTTNQQKGCCRTTRRERLGDARDDNPGAKFRNHLLIPDDACADGALLRFVGA
ncbi:hypothetical protein C8F01DRAFT_1311057 [Mycena amicta]|nr:hypothetical protein C8F01DRAFT_1311057 [Mycena amicta]